MKGFVRLGLMFSLLACPNAQANRMVAGAVTLLLGGAAAKSFANGTELDALESQAGDLAKQIRKKNPSLQNPAVYSLYFSVDHGFFSESRWADVNGSGADIFAKISIEGGGAFIIPEIIYNNRGQPLLMTVVTEEIPPNSKVVLTLYDDDSVGDKVWNGILQSRTNVKTGLSTGNAYMSLQVSTDGDIQILNTDVVIDNPDYIASVFFTTPTDDEKWTADGIIRDKFRRKVGRLQFAKCLSAHDLSTARAKYRGKKVFWFVLGGVFITVSIKQLPKLRNGMDSRDVKKD